MPDENYLPWESEGDDDGEYGSSGFDYSSPDDLVLRGILAEVGLESADEIVIDLERVKPENIKSVRFSTLTEAIVWLHNIGILGFSGVFRYESGEYGAATADDTDQPFGYLLDTPEQ